WDSPEAARSEIQRVMANVDVVVGNQTECQVAVGESDPETAAEALMSLGPGLVIVKRGPEGVFARRNGDAVSVRPMEVDVVNGLGAGDAFGGALCHGLLAGWDLERVIRFANAAGGIVASRLECSTAMPTTE